MYNSSLPCLSFLKRPRIGKQNDIVNIWSWFKMKYYKNILCLYVILWTRSVHRRHPHSFISHSMYFISFILSMQLLRYLNWYRNSPRLTEHGGAMKFDWTFITTKSVGISLYMNVCGIMFLCLYIELRLQIFDIYKKNISPTLERRRFRVIF